VTKDRRLGRGLAALLGNPDDDSNQTGNNQGGGAQNAAKQPVNVEKDAAKKEPPANQASSTPVETGPRIYNPAPAKEQQKVALKPTGGESDSERLLQLNVDEIEENPFQPRREFSATEIASLAESLKTHEMLQPILVRRVGEKYQLISGERRLRAAVHAGWKQIPARLREADDRLVAELAIVENLQRKDLNAIEKAMSFKRYLDEHQCKQDDLAGRLKIDRSTIANLIRLLDLPEEIQSEVGAGRLTAGHARALLPLGEEPLQIEFAKRIRDLGWSVRETERQVQETILAEDSPRGAPRSAAASRTRSNHVQSLEQELRTALGTRVDIQQQSKGKGKITLHFRSHDDFERLFDVLTGEDLDHQSPPSQRMAG